jgi:AmmeMemoRadiSam system protein B
MRQPVALGFYPPSPEALREKIEECFLHRLGPGYLPTERKHEKHIISAIVPHAGYDYSGPCAAWVYKELYENWNFDTVIIIGTNHTKTGSKISTLVSEDWLTPFGVVKTDKEFGKLLIQNTDALDDPTPHIYEHSIEVQLPFLQYISPNLQIVPILFNGISLEEIQDFSKALIDISEDLGRKTLVLCSTDFTHHGSVYGYTLFEENPIENVRSLDLEYIQKILDLDSKGFLELISKYNGTVCGKDVVLAFIEYSKLCGAHPDLLSYYNSGELTLDQSIIVGYASLISFSFS